MLRPDPGAIERAVEILNAGSKVAILIGQGAREAAAEVQEVAERTGAGVAKALLGKDVLPDDLPYVTGAIGLHLFAEIAKNKAAELLPRAGLHSESLG